MSRPRRMRAFRVWTPTRTYELFAPARYQTNDGKNREFQRLTDRVSKESNAYEITEQTEEMARAFGADSGLPPEEWVARYVRRLESRPEVEL